MSLTDDISTFTNSQRFTHVVVDGNHMLAGQNLKFNVEVVAIREATEEELSESDAEVLNRKLAYLQSLDEKPTISVTYFVPDDKKEGGSYHTATGIVKSVEPDKGVLQFEDGTGIPVIRIKDIDGECFLTE